MKTCNGGIGLLLRTIGHESEATRTASVTIPHHDGIQDVSVLCESFTERVIGRVPAQVTNIDLGAHVRYKVMIETGFEMANNGA